MNRRCKQACVLADTNSKSQRANTQAGSGVSADTAMEMFAAAFLVVLSVQPYKEMSFALGNIEKATPMRSLPR